MWRTPECDKICKKGVKNIEKLQYFNKDCSKQIIWRELNRTVCLALASVL